MAHRTHGLAMLPLYLQRIEAGLIKPVGDIAVVNETPATLSWQAHRLPGPFVMNEALTVLFEKLRTSPVVTATIANCSHIGSLQTYLHAVGERKLLGLMMVTDPGAVSVAPFGAAEAVLTSNPIAAAIPTQGDPILVDQSTSLVSNARVQSAAPGELLPGEWLLDAQGRPSRDPSVLLQSPSGTLMPLGGSDFGYQGFGFMLMCEAFALALSGHGRREPKTRGAQGVFLQLIDPAAFAGAEETLAETSYIADRCVGARPAEGSAGVRLPGQRALSEMRRQLRDGLEISPPVWERLLAISTRFGVPPPSERE
ncbi:Ldh family oxidoreductase [Marinivivus vitaminiproducens]|uniref:Ldh family oxidoreductase n=1 Tax=Marinivivus vitaminiproducens TaxID=3035935 RepID=UPI0027A1AF95|nr:Ldh family oxidoreductase [Geminicoccaceae bacterium SCSIO 64248]